MFPLIKRLFRTPAGLLVRRIVLLYVVLALCRVAFGVYNAPTFGGITWSELRQLLAGSLLFDTASVVYADGLFVLLSLLPLHLRERGWYRNITFGYYVAVNSLVVALNLADAIYFRYTQKRFTADEIFFADNDNTLQLIGTFMAENWYLVLLWVLLTALLVRGYGRRIREESLLRGGWPYYAGGTIALLLAAGLCLGGARGGFTRMTRPITLSNATLYTSDNARANLILSNPFCILRTVGSGGGLSCRQYFPAEELDARFTPVHQPADSAAVDLQGRNVVLFIMESMSAEHSALLRPDLYADRPQKGFTPFLDSLMQNGLCFKRMYANGTRSIQAMPSVLGSIPSFRTPFVLMPQSLGASRQLPALLADRGYATAFFCGSERGSMGFGAYARSAGIERLVSREDYEERHGGVPAIPGRRARHNARTLLRLDVHPLVAPPLRGARALRHDAARGLHPHPQGRGLRRCGLPPLLPPLLRQGVVPPHDLRLRGRPCLLGEVRPRDARVPRKHAHHRLPPHAGRSPAGFDRRGGTTIGHHAHAARTARQPRALLRLRLRSPSSRVPSRSGPAGRSPTTASSAR